MAIIILELNGQLRHGECAVGMKRQGRQEELTAGFWLPWRLAPGGSLEAAT
jgi:hypothetical protein